MKKTLLLAAMMVAVLSICARPRSIEEMKAATMEVLAQKHGAGSMGVKKNPNMLEMREGVAVFGFEEGGYAVIANDDVFPAVMGWSETLYNPETPNANFKWWLETIDRLTADPANAAYAYPSSVLPDSLGYPSSVDPFLKTLWNQGSPSNIFCPNGSYTGCVATAAAQVLKYFEWPKQGMGTVFTYFPFANFEGQRCEEQLDEVEYEYDLMLNDYNDMVGKISSKQRAVAKLMYHVGLAMKAIYSNGGTGAYNETLCYGLRNNLRYPLAVTLNKDDYTLEQWMGMIFDQISRGIPIIYGGSDSDFSGHEFVLHGYNKHGNIYINWGWGGIDDGYFNLAFLYAMGYYDFNFYQDMVIRCSPEWLSADTLEVEVETPGTLEELIGEERLDSIVSLKVKGKINSTDFRTLRTMAGRGFDSMGTMGNLSLLDLSETEIVAGGQPYLVEGDSTYVTSDNVMPYKAFAGCTFLVNVILPNHLERYEDGVFAQCVNLDHVTLKAGEESDFIVDGEYVFSKERDELIECLPGVSEDIHYSVPYGVKIVHPYAFAGRYLYERLTLPETVDSIGEQAFNRCFDLTDTYLYAHVPPAIDESTIDLLDLSLRTIYVPKGCKQAYADAKGWALYGRRIKEFDTEASDIHLFPVTSQRTNVQQGVYDVAGRRVASSTNSRGIYVVAGRKAIK